MVETTLQAAHARAAAVCFAWRRSVLAETSLLGVRLAGQQPDLLSRVAPLQQALQGLEDVPGQLCVLVGPVVPAPFNTLYGPGAYELHGARAPSLCSHDAQSLDVAFSLHRGHARWVDAA